MGDKPHGNARIQALASMLKENNTIKSLSLMHCAVDDNGAILLPML